MPPPASGNICNIFIAGIGGTGVSTLAGNLIMAARVDGIAGTAVNQTGLSQKNGGVTSQIRLARDKSLDGHMVRLPSHEADLLIGCDAGTLNFAKIKGSHTAMKSGMLAAEAVHKAITEQERASDDLTEYTEAFNSSWLYKELYQQRNFGPAQHKWGNLVGSAYSFVDINIFNGSLPWTFEDKKADHAAMKPAAEAKKITYPKPDGKITFDRLASVFLSNTNHEEDQPCHLTLKDPNVPIDVNLPKWNEPAQRYCPAGVYEVVENEENGDKRFQINAQNCVHCKTCDIKDPTQNIVWVAPEGYGGPNYPNM